MMTTLLIAIHTYRQTVTAGVFWLLMLTGTLALWTLLFIPFFTFKEDVKMFKDVSSALVMTLSLAVALLSASRVVDEEFETKTAVTLLSKPVRDTQLLFGKYFGVAATVICAVIILGLSLEVTSFIRLWMDDFWRRRSAIGKQVELLSDCWLQVWSMLPNLVLVALQSVLMTAFAVALSTRLPLAPTVVLCLLVFVAGHLSPVLVSLGEYRLDPRAMQTLVRADAPAEVLSKLEPLRDLRYQTAEEFDAAVAGQLLITEREAHASAIRAASAGWAAGNPWRRTLIWVVVLVVPDLERCHNIIDTIAYKPLVFGADEPLPEKVRWIDIWRFVGASAVYTLGYSTAVLLVGLAMLRRREVST